MNQHRRIRAGLLGLICTLLLYGCMSSVTGGLYNIKADRHYESGDKQTAFTYYLQSAEKGSAESQYIVSQMLLYSDGVDSDFQAGLHWLNLAAEQDHLAAARALGLHLLNGDFDIPRNPDRAVQMLTKAAWQNDSFSMLILGHLYFTGYSTPADPQKAADWYRQAAQNGEEVPAQWLDARYLAKVQPARKYSQKLDDRARIKRAQAGLKALGYYRGKIDGLYGPGTAGAVKRFQKASKVATTGRVDSVLMRQIYSRIVYSPMTRHL